jgi:hypothetical protein
LAILPATTRSRSGSRSSVRHQADHLHDQQCA